MGITAGIWMALLGVLAVPSLLLSKRPDAKEALAKISPYQGWIGALSAFWGAWIVIHAFLNLAWLSHHPVWWATYLATGVIQLALGLLLGIGVLGTFIKAPLAKEKLDLAVARLSPFQGKLGLLGVLLGIWCVIANFVFL